MNTLFLSGNVEELRGRKMLIPGLASDLEMIVLECDHAYLSLPA